MSWETGSSEWEDPNGAAGGGGGGGGAAPARVATDSHTKICYYDLPHGDLGSATEVWTNSGTGGALPLTVHASGSSYMVSGMQRAGARVQGNFSDGCLLPASIDYGGGGTMLVSAGTTLDETAALTASAWVWIPALPAGSVWGLLLGKQAGVGSWTPPYADWGLYHTPDAQLVALVTYAAGSSIVAASDFDLLSSGLHHIGMTISGSMVKLYLDGDQVGAVTLAGPRATNGGRLLVSGMPVADAVSPRYSAGALGDIRIEDTARDAAWFAAVWATRRTA